MAPLPASQLLRRLIPVLSPLLPTRTRRLTALILVAARRVFARMCADQSVPGKKSTHEAKVRSARRSMREARESRAARGPPPPPPRMPRNPAGMPPPRPGWNNSRKL